MPALRPQGVHNLPIYAWLILLGFILFFQYPAPTKMNLKDLKNLDLAAGFFSSPNATTPRRKTVTTKAEAHIALLKKQQPSRLHWVSRYKSSAMMAKRGILMRLLSYAFRTAVQQPHYYYRSPLCYLHLSSTYLYQLQP